MEQLKEFIVKIAMFLHSTALAVALALLSVAGAGAQASQEEIARQVLSENPGERVQGVLSARRIPPEEVGPTLRTALIQALDRDNRAYRRQMQAVWRDQPFDPIRKDGNVRLDLVELVEALKDPQAIPALVGALGTGASVAEALADFGERAAPAVLVAVTKPSPAPDQIRGGLLALRFMVEAAEHRPLPARTMDAIRAAARERLTGSQVVTVLWHAIDLAVVMGDPELQAMVEALAADAEEVRARGIEDPDLIERTQRRAGERLAGIPPPLTRY